jgi:metallo-beta-lactamase family protein
MPPANGRDLDIRLSFLGAGQSVTGSRFLVEANGYRFLVDCGLYQEREFQARNWDAFAVPPESINAVLLTHAHVDHTGWLPRLVQGGFRGNVYCTPATADITRIILLDSAKLQEQDAAYKERRHRKEGRKGPHPEVPLYTTADAEATLPLFSAVPYEETLEMADGISASFHDAGHVLGSSMIKVRISQNGDSRTILFSGDVGRWDKPILQDPSTFEQADYVLVESTYGNRSFGDTSNTAEEFAEVINTTFERGGNVVIPSFALERSQEILYCLNEILYSDRTASMTVFVDSPMAVNVTDVFRNHPDLFDEDMMQRIQERRSPFDFPGLTLVRTVDESKAIGHLTRPAIIIAGSGMCTGGRIKYHLVDNISRPESTILFVGYQAAGTLGRRIVEGADEVRILGKYRRVRARVTQIHGFSGHADKDQLLRWLSALKEPPRRVFVVHGESESAFDFATLVTTRTGWPTTVPDYGDQITLD